jgi:hypothetical protein
MERPAAADPAYHSVFGGLWTDRRDAMGEIDRRVEATSLAPADADLLRHWVTHGYVVLKRAVDPEMCDLVRSDLERALGTGDERLLVFAAGRKSPEPLVAGTDIDCPRVRDVYVYYESARMALFSEPIALPPDGVRR